MCEARLEGMGAVYTRTENALEVRWWQHQRRDILDMYDEVVGKEARWGDHCKILVLPDGSMKGWEREGLCFDRPPKDEVSWVRLGRTREAAILNRKRKVRGELWFLGPPRAWAQMDWTALGRYADSDVGVEWVCPEDDSTCLGLPALVFWWDQKPPC